MNKLKIGVFLFFSMLTTAFTQPDNGLSRADARVKWGNNYEEPSNSDIQKIIATEGGGLYALRLRRGGVLGKGGFKAVLEYYDGDMKLARSKELDLEYKGKQRMLKDVVMLEGKLWLITYFYNEKHEKTYLFAQRIDNERFTLSKDLIKLSEQDDSNIERQDVFSLSTSRDSSKMVIFTQQPSEKRKNEFSLAVFDGNMKEVWGMNTKLPYGRNNYRVQETQVDKEGNVYLMGVIYAEGVNRLEQKGKPTYQYNLLAYMRDSSLGTQEYKMSLRDKFITDLTFRPADNGELVFSGFFSEKSAQSVKGTCLFRINTTEKRMSDISTNEFALDFLTVNFSDRNRERARTASLNNDKEREAELPSYSLDKLILRSDGGALLIAEQYFIDERWINNNRWGNAWGLGGWGGGWYDPWGWNDPFMNGRNQQTDYYFNYNDIIVVNISPTGQIDWSARIPKRQTSINDGGLYSSYAMSVVADKLLFVYNEDPRNLDPNRKRNVADSPDGNSVVVLAEVNKNGAVKRQPLFQNREAGVVTRPKICRQIGRYDMAIYGEQGNRGYKFGKVSFQD